MHYIILLAVLFLFTTIRAEGDVPAEHLLAALDYGTQATQKLFMIDEGKQPSVEILSLQSNKKAIFWNADMDIDCDGEPDDKCNENTDPWFYPSTSAGDGIYASETPFYVVPVTFKNYVSGVNIGTVGAVIYKGKVVYGPLLDKCGMDDVTGEASYAMAEALGINPDPKYGGTSGPVIYIAFVGKDAELDDDEYTDHEKAVEIGNARAKELVEFFNVTDINAFKQSDKPVHDPDNGYAISVPEIKITTAGHHSITVTNFRGQQIMTVHGEGAHSYTLPEFSAGLYIISIVTPTASVVERFILY